jgi:alkylhydroperoxidase family enzyme
MSRIPYPEPSDLSDAKRAFLAAPSHRLLNVVRMALHTPDGLWERQRDLSAATVLMSSMDPMLREVLILTVAHLSRSGYELHHHLSIARNLGMEEAVLGALERGDYAALGEQERAVARFTAEVVRDVSPSDATLDEARALFGDPMIFEMIAIIGVYMMTARVAAVGGCEPDQTAVSSWDREKAAG